MGRNIDFPPLAIKKKLASLFAKKNALLLHLYCHNCEQQQKPKAYQGKAVDNEKKEEKNEKISSVWSSKKSVRRCGTKKKHTLRFFIYKSPV